MPEVQKITPYLWFDDRAEEAAALYVSLFDDSEILSTTRYGEAGPGPKGSVMMVSFQLAGLKVLALNGGPVFQLTEAFSLLVSCETQDEVDELWEKLGAGGETGKCGWLKDRFGLSWQIVPSALPDLMQRGDADSSRRVMEAMLKMTKLEIAGLEAAFRR